MVLITLRLALQQNYFRLVPGDVVLSTVVQMQEMVLWLLSSSSDKDQIMRELSRESDMSWTHSLVPITTLSTAMPV